MTVTIAQLCPPTQLVSGVSVLYTCPTATTARIDQFTLANHSVGAVKATVYVVPSGGTAGVTNTVIPQFTINAGVETSVTDMKNHVLKAGDKLQVQLDTGAAIVAMVSGIQVT